MEVTLKKCQTLVEKVLAISTVEEYKTIVHYMDRLSDLLCRIIDLADFVRSTHPNRAFQQQATLAHLSMFNYMNTLNTTPGLNDQLKTALSNPQVTSTWSEEELRVAQILRKDFSQSAINLPKGQREAFVLLSGEINEVGSRFIDGMQPQDFQVKLGSGRLQGLDPRLVQQYKQYNGDIKVPTFGPPVSQVLNNAEDESTRKTMYIRSRTAAGAQVKLVEDLMTTRAMVAKLSGFDSYARMALNDKMAGTPEAVSKFLDALAADNKSHVKAELKQLGRVKKSMDNNPSSVLINAWDRDYYRRRMLEASNRPNRTSDLLPSFFSLGTVMQGLSRLFSSLYGVRFQPVEPLPGETWSPDVRRLDVVDENDTRIAILYCDLFAREGKSPNPAHFTLRCSRLISAAEIAENASQEHDPSGRKALPIDPVALANDGMATTSLPDGSAYQLPTIALICDFPSPKPNQKRPPLLPTAHLTTLFHEMGHAIHSILGRTKLQNVSGTRCATDFAELPSILMEHFATNPAVLSLYARHWETDAPLPPELATQIQERALAADTPREGAADTEWQIILSLLDQAYHSPLAADPKTFDSTAIAHDIYSKYSSVPEPKETRWQGFFGHLVGYGGSYYSYLFDRAIAARVWEKVFNNGKGGEAVSRENGEKFKKEVLGWGGSREPWRCVAGVLGDARLENGGEEAMEIVGRWGVSR